MRPVLLASSIIVAVGSVVTTPAQQAPAASVLVAARQAIGGDAAIGAVTSIDVKGTLTRTLNGRGFEESVEYASILPDRFVRVTESTSNLGPLGTSFHRRRLGLAGDDPITEDDNDSPLPMPVTAMQAATTPAEIAAKRAKSLALHKRSFAAFTLPLFAASLPSDPITFTIVGRIAGPTGPADAIDATGADGFVQHLFFDATTHLIAGVTWMDKPIVSGSVSVGVAVSSRGQVMGASPPSILPGDPTAGLADVQWQLTIADYRAANGLTWPHRLTSTFGGRKYEDVRLGTYRINPKIDAGVFRVSK